MSTTTETTGFHEKEVRETGAYSVNNLDTSSDAAETHYNDEKQDEEQAPEPVRQTTGWKWIFIMIAIQSSIFYYALDNTVVADIQAVIVEHFDALDELSWLSTAFLLGATVTNLVWGRLYSQFNSKWLYIFNVALFEVGSAVCGAAPNMTALIVGRVLCGVGGAGIYVGVMTLIAVTTTLTERPLYIGLTGITWGIGVVLGPVIGGAFSESSVGWRWAFYINLLIGAVFAPVYLFMLPSIDPRPGVVLKERATQLDYVGIILQMGCLTSFVLALNWGGITYAWSSGTIIGLFVCAGVLLILLGIQQVWTIFTDKERRIIPIEFFYSRTVLLLFSCTSAAAATAFVPIYFIPIFFQFTRSDGPLEAGVRLLPFIAVLVVFIFINGALLPKFGYYMPWYTVGGLLAVAGSALMYTVNTTTSTSRIYGYTVLIGTGVGLWLQASFSIAQAVVGPALVPAAVGFITLAQFLGITISLAIANSIFLNGSEEKLTELLPNASSDQIALAVQGAGSSLVQGLSPELREQVLDAIVSNIDKTYILVIAAGSLVTVLSFLMKRERLFAIPAAAAA